jgi:hypothetical protein
MIEAFPVFPPRFASKLREASSIQLPQQIVRRGLVGKRHRGRSGLSMVAPFCSSDERKPPADAQGLGQMDRSLPDLHSKICIPEIPLKHLRLHANFI